MLLSGPQRLRFHLHRALAKRRLRKRRALGILPQRVRRDAQAAPLVHGEADLQRRHERVPLPQGLLREAGRGPGEGGGGAEGVAGGAGEDHCDPEGVLGEEGGEVVGVVCMCLWRGGTGRGEWGMGIRYFGS